MKTNSLIALCLAAAALTLASCATPPEGPNGTANQQVQVLSMGNRQIIQNCRCAPPPCHERKAVVAKLEPPKKICHAPPRKVEVCAQKEKREERRCETRTIGRVCPPPPPSEYGIIAHYAVRERDKVFDARGACAGERDRYRFGRVVEEGCATAHRPPRRPPPQMGGASRREFSSQSSSSSSSSYQSSAEFGGR